MYNFVTVILCLFGTLQFYQMIAKKPPNFINYNQPYGGKHDQKTKTMKNYVFVIKIYKWWLNFNKIVMTI